MNPKTIAPLCPVCQRTMRVVPLIPGSMLTVRTCGVCGAKARVQVRYRPEDPCGPVIQTSRLREDRPQ